MQLRNPNEVVLDFIKKKVHEHKDVFVSQRKEVTDGIDIFFSSRRFVYNLGHKLQKEFGGELKVSPRIFTRNKLTSKDVYRLEVYYRLPSVKKGDSITLRGEDYMVLVVAKKLYVRHKKTGKKSWVDFKHVPKNSA